MGRPITWPDLDGLSPRDAQQAMNDYTAGTESKPLSANFERAGLSVVSLSMQSVYRQLEDEIDDRDYSCGSVALRADDIHLAVADRPNAPVLDSIVGGGSHSRPMRTKVIRSLGNDCELIDVLSEQHDIAVMVWCDVVASPNNAPNRREVLHSTGQTVQRHVISQNVRGASIPARQTVDASEASYETVNVDSLPNRPLTLSDLRLEFGIDNSRKSHPFVAQLSAAIRAIELAIGMGFDLPADTRRFVDMR